MFRGFSSIFYKEIIQVSRDPLTLALMLIVPMLQLLIFGYAINTDVRNIKTAVYDMDHRREARELIAAFQNTDNFTVSQYVNSDEELNRAIVAGNVKVGIKIPSDYSERLAAGRQASVLVLIDGSDSSIASQSLTVSTSVGLRESIDRLSSRFGQTGVEFPIGSMPLAMQVLGYLIPATHFIEIIREIVLRGATLTDLMPKVVTLAVMGLVLVVLSALRFGRKLRE